ncbi:DUF3298 and DUF4163 domain-containing protein [uncultured Croceitalea sp.]|uniref:DUF3298 and DUF4163 domain-containing protein n=1 Tax=uncultured Croceitalea sp. TaxID=1798908 RepID=UPI0033068309
MKNVLPTLFLSILLLCCESESKLTFEIAQLENTSCSNCPEINISIPRALGETRIAEKINTTINEELIYTLKFEDSINVDSVKGAMESFTQSYQGFKKEFDEETISWEAKANGEVSFESSFLLSITLNTYTFTGGAHGYAATTFLNFDKGKNLELEPYQLFKDLEGFIALAEIKFREAQEIPKTSNINATGFMFSGDRFHLPENLGFTEKGIQLIYNQYEIASYADGPIELLLPFEEVNQFLKKEYQVII